MTAKRLGLMLKVEEGDVRLEFPETISEKSMAKIQRWLERTLVVKGVPAFKMAEWNWRHPEVT